MDAFDSMAGKIERNITEPRTFALGKAGIGDGIDSHPFPYGRQMIQMTSPSENGLS